MVTIKGIDPKMIANNLEPSEPTHPGELLKEEIEYRGISQKKLAQEIGISYKVLNDILNCRRPVTTNTALLVEAALGIPAHILTGLQMDYNMQTAKKDKSFMERLASWKLRHTNSLMPYHSHFAKDIKTRIHHQ